MKTRTIDKIFEVVRIILAILLAFALTLVILIFVSKDPVNAVKEFLTGPFKTVRRMGNMVELAIPYIFTGVGMCFLYSAGQFNTVGEGIFFFSGCTISLTCLALIPLNLPPVIYPFVLITVGALVGIGISFIPGILKIKWKVNDVVMAIMLQNILQYFGKWIVITQMRDPSISYNASYKLPENALIGKMIPGTRIHYGLIIALIVVVIATIIIYKSPLGYSMRLVGKNDEFAQYAGINVKRSILSAQLIGGALAGIGGAVEILGMYERFQWGGLTQHGIDGTMVAVLAKSNPALVPFTSLLLAYLRIGADLVNMKSDIPAEFITVIQSIVIMLVAAEQFLVGTKNKIIYKTAQKRIAKKEENK